LRQALRPRRLVEFDIQDALLAILLLRLRHRGFYSEGIREGARRISTMKEQRSPKARREDPVACVKCRWNCKFQPMKRWDP
jgi:hypothetical protein